MSKPEAPGSIEAKLKDPSSLTVEERYLTGMVLIDAASASEFPEDVISRQQAISDSANMAINALKVIRNDKQFIGEDRFVYGTSALQQQHTVLDQEALSPHTKWQYYTETMSLIGQGAAEVLQTGATKARKSSLTGSQAVGLLRLLEIGYAAALLKSSPVPLGYQEQLEHFDKTLKDNPDIARKYSLTWAGLLLVTSHPVESDEDGQTTTQGIAEEQIIAVFDHFRQKDDIDAMTQLVAQTDHEIFLSVFAYYHDNKDSVTVDLLKARMLSDLQTLPQQS